MSLAGRKRKRYPCPVVGESSNAKSYQFEEIIVQNNGKDKYLADSCLESVVRKDNDVCRPEETKVDEKHIVIEISDSDSDDFDACSDVEIGSEIESDDLEDVVSALTAAQELQKPTTNNKITTTSNKAIENVDCISLASTSSENEDENEELWEDVNDISVVEDHTEDITEELPELKETKNVSTKEPEIVVDCFSSAKWEEQPTASPLEAPPFKDDQVQVDCFSSAKSEEQPTASPLEAPPLKDDQVQVQEKSQSPCRRSMRKAAAKCNQLNRSQQIDTELLEFKDKLKSKGKTSANIACSFSCLFACNTKLNVHERQQIYDGFWNLNQKSKKLFYAQFTRRLRGKQKCIYQFFFPSQQSEDNRIEICSNFFFGTLNISPMRIQWFYSYKGRKGKQDFGDEHPGFDWLETHQNIFQETATNLTKPEEQEPPHQHQQNESVPKNEILQNIHCPVYCSFSCVKKINLSQRQKIYDVFWNLNKKDRNKYYGKYAKRSRGIYKYFVYRYFFPSGSDSGPKRIEVCASFFLRTLNISPTRIQWYYKKLERSRLNGTIETEEEEEEEEEEEKQKIEEVSSFDGLETQDSKNNITLPKLETQKIEKDEPMESVDCVSLAFATSSKPEPTLPLEAQSAKYDDEPMETVDCVSLASTASPKPEPTNPLEAQSAPPPPPPPPLPELPKENQNFQVSEQQRKRIETIQCSRLCRFGCYLKFDNCERQKIYVDFKNLDRDGKYLFYGKFTKKIPGINRYSSYQYFFKSQPQNKVIQVCQNFFLKTLDISPMRLQWYYNFKRRNHMQKLLAQRQYFEKEATNTMELETHNFKNNTEPHGMDTGPAISILNCFSLASADSSLSAHPEIASSLEALAKNHNQDTPQLPPLPPPAPAIKNEENFFSNQDQQQEQQQQQPNDKELEEEQAAPLQRKILENFRCPSLCIFSCYKHFTLEERQKIHDVFINFSKRSRDLYYAEFTKRFHGGNVYFTFQYYLPSESQVKPIQVCRHFFLNTLNISATRIQWYYKCKSESSKRIIRKKSNRYTDQNVDVVEAKSLQHAYTPQPSTSSVHSEELAATPLLDNVLIEKFPDIEDEDTAPKNTNLCVQCASCVFECDIKFSINDRQKIRQAFWNLDKNSRDLYYAQYTRRLQGRQKYYSYQYFFPSASESDAKLVQVCQPFFLNTLDISSMRIQWYYSYRHRFSAKRNMIKQKVEEVKQHVNSFECLETHYCTNNRKIMYFAPHWNVRKMFAMYKKQCKGKPVSKHIYYKVCNQEFNLLFENPPAKRCSLCDKTLESSRSRMDDVELSETDKAKLRTLEENSLLLYMINRS